MSRAAVIATLPDWDSRRLDPSMGNGMAARSGTFNRIRRIAADRRSIANLKLTEDPALPDVLIVTFDEDGVAKSRRFHAAYKEIR